MFSFICLWLAIALIFYPKSTPSLLLFIWFRLLLIFILSLRELRYFTIYSTLSPTSCSSLISFWLLFFIVSYVSSRPNLPLKHTKPLWQANALLLGLTPQAPLPLLKLVSLQLSMYNMKFIIYIGNFIIRCRFSRLITVWLYML